jgi:hypothetical protein
MVLPVVVLPVVVPALTASVRLVRCARTPLPLS